LLSNEFFPLRINQNRCRLGLRPRPHWRKLQRSPHPLAGFKTADGESRGGEGRTEREEGKGGGNGGIGKGREKGEVGE